jgi:DNA-binding LytR/AlgR family response regulator
VEGFNMQVTDYLLKPVDFARFMKAADKLLLPQRLPDLSPVSRTVEAPPRPYYFFNINKRSVKIFLDEILYIESLKDTVAIVTTDKTYHTHYQLGELESFLPDEQFLRIHRSFMIATGKIQMFSATEISVANRRLPVGRSHKSYVMNRLGKK